MPTRRRALLIISALALLALASMALALMVGSINIPFHDVVAILFAAPDSMPAEVVLSLRLPRALSGFACGGLLALSGALLQVLQTRMTLPQGKAAKGDPSAAALSQM